MYYFRTLTKLHKLKHFQSFTIDTIQTLFQVRKKRKPLLRHSSANTILLLRGSSMKRIVVVKHPMVF